MALSQSPCAALRAAKCKGDIYKLRLGQTSRPGAWSKPPCPALGPLDLRTMLTLSIGYQTRCPRAWLDHMALRGSPCAARGAADQRAAQGWPGWH
eukprot:scaffold284994_cov21-Tisochrysis_lutea.AAC.1